MQIEFVVILNEKTHNPRLCTKPNCYGFIFVKTGDQLLCRRCTTANVVNPEVETVGQYPRPNKEYSDRLNLIDRFSFWRGESSVQRVPDYSGKWVEHDEVMELVDEAQHEINSLRAQLERYQANGE